MSAAGDEGGWRLADGATMAASGCRGCGRGMAVDAPPVMS
jgi:hypothetical protein